MKSIFLKMEGDIPQNRIWDFLIVHQDYDYSMKDIAKFSKVGYTTLKALWKDFIKRDIIVKTRTIGRAKMFKLNLKNPVVKKFIEYCTTVVETEVRKELKMEKETNEAHTRNISSTHAMPVSAKNL